MNKLTSSKYLYIVLAMLPITILVVGLMLLLHSPYTGLNFTKQNGKWYISSINPDSPAAQYPELQGKELVALNEHTLGRYDLEVEFDDIPTWKILQEYWEIKKDFSEHYIKIGSPLTLTTLDNGKTQIFTIIPTNISLLYGILKSWPIMLSAFLYLFVSLTVILKKNNNLPAQLFFLCGFSVSIMFVAVKLIHTYDIAYVPLFLQFLYIIYGLTNIFASLFLLHFFLIFPKDISNLQSNRIFLSFLYIFAIITYILYATKIFYLGLYIYLIFIILIGLYFLIKHYIKLNSLDKTQVNVLYFGFGIILLIDIFIYLLPPLFVGHRIVDQEAMFLLLSLLPIFMAFSIMRYKLMNISTMFDNTLVYGITLGGLALVDIVIISSLVNLGILTTANTPIMIAVSVWGIALIYMWLRNFVQDWIKILLKRERYNTNDISLEFSRNLLLLHDTRDAFSLMRDLIDKALHPKNAHAFILDKEGHAIPIWYGDPPDIPVSLEQIKQLKETAPLYQMTEPEYLPENYSGGVIVPVKADKGTIGYYLFQDKRSERLYDSDDMKLFNIMSNQLAMSIETINAREETKRKEMEAIREKERISREIHDGIGSRFVEASMLSDQIVREADKADKVAGYGKNMKNILLDGLADLRELIWAVEPGPSNINAIVSHVKDKIKNLSERGGGFKASADIYIENEETPIPAIMKLNLIRVIQEALTNTIKHAKATAVELSMVQKGDNLTIRITDNGTGFDVTRLGTAGHGVRNIKKRCNDIGATLDIGSEPSKGTSITISITLRPE